MRIEIRRFAVGAALVMLAMSAAPARPLPVGVSIGAPAVARGGTLAGREQDRVPGCGVPGHTIGAGGYCGSRGAQQYVDTMKAARRIGAAFAIVDALCWRSGPLHLAWKFAWWIVRGAKLDVRRAWYFATRCASC